MTKTHFERESTVARGLALDHFAIRRDGYVRKNIVDPVIGVGKKLGKRKRRHNNNKK